MQFAGDRAAAHGITRLQDDRSQPGLGKIEGGCQAVVASTDDDDLTHVRVSEMIFIAAFRPGAPMIPPPGWVAEPHI